MQTASALFMTNDLVGAKGGGDVMPCLALTNNDSYLMSACGGKVSLFNVLTFRVIFESRVIIICASYSQMS